MRSIHPQNFITIACIGLEICTGQNLSMKKKKQRDITQRLGKQELRFMCTALPLDEMYLPTKFHNHSRHSIGDMHRTKVKYESKQRAITQRKKKNKSYNSCALHSPLMRSIHQQNFITIGSIVLENCSRQNSSMKVNKGQ